MDACAQHPLVDLNSQPLDACTELLRERRQRGVLAQQIKNLRVRLRHQLKLLEICSCELLAMRGVGF